MRSVWPRLRHSPLAPVLLAKHQLGQLRLPQHQASRPCCLKISSRLTLAAGPICPILRPPRLLGTAAAAAIAEAEDEETLSLSSVSDERVHGPWLDAMVTHGRQEHGRENIAVSSGICDMPADKAIENLPPCLPSHPHTHSCSQLNGAMLDCFFFGGVSVGQRAGEDCSKARTGDPLGGPSQQTHKSTATSLGQEPSSTQRWVVFF